MVKIKGWKKKFEVSDQVLFKHKETRIIITDEGKTKKWSLWISSYLKRKGKYVDINKEFDTKQEAKRYAIQYMKKHPKG